MRERTEEPVSSKTKSSIGLNNPINLTDKGNQRGEKNNRDMKDYRKKCIRCDEPKGLTDKKRVFRYLFGDAH